MTKYLYTAKSDPGHVVKGDLEAESREDAVKRLLQMGYSPMFVGADQSRLKPSGFFSFKKIREKDIIFFTRQLSVLLDAGISVMSALGSVSKQTVNPRLKDILGGVMDKIKDGHSLSESLGFYPSVFSNLYCSMVRGGEAGGYLKESIKRLAEYLEKTQNYKNTLIDSLTYPLFVLMTGVLTVLVLLLFVIPRIVQMFQDMGQALPLPTRILIALSEAIRRDGWIAVAALGAGFFFFLKGAKTFRGKELLDRLTLRIPLAGNIILKAEISRFMRMVSLLLSGGMSIVLSLETSAGTMENGVIKAEVLRFKEEIVNGSSFSESMKSSKFFTEFVVNIVSVGEETGSLDASLMRISESYEKEVDATLKIAARLAEPVIILVVGLFVGFIVLSMLLPIFEINFMVK